LGSNLSSRTRDDPKSCAAHPQCAGLSGDCCPRPDGTMMQCCDAECSTHQACQDEGIEGYCCPNTKGVMLQCCDRGDAKRCDFHPQCAGQHGDCCPSADGVMLQCCNAQCSRHTTCLQEGREGNCCPGDDGAMLGCCGGSGVKSCDAHPQCAGKPGDCCPNDHGVMVDCCNAQCSNHAKCVAAGLTGMCCPNYSGIMYECCEDSAQGEQDDALVV